MADGDKKTKDPSEKKPSTRLSEWLLVLLIVFTLGLEFVLHKIEHWVNHRHAHLQAVLKVLYRELMILGLVSFIFVIYETIDKPTKKIILSFEFAHFFIFLLAVVYTIVVCISMFTSLRLSARWKKMEQVDLVKYLHLKEQYTSMRMYIHKHKGPFWRVFWWWFPNFFKLRHYCNLHEMMAFHDIRFQFIFYRNLPEHFRFSSFLRKIKSVTFVNLVESHWSLYIIFLVVVLLDLLRRYATGNPGEIDSDKESDTQEKPAEIDVAESVFIICASILLAAFGQVLAIKIRKIYWELTKNPRIYYEGVEAAAVEEEIAAADARISEQKMRRRASKSADDGDTTTDADDEATEASRVSAAAAEVMDPMHLQITPTNLGVPNPELASPIVRAPSMESSMTTEILPQNFRPSDAGSSQPSSRPFHYGGNAEDDLKEIAARHSLDFKNYSRNARVSGTSLEYNRNSRVTTPSHEVHVPVDFSDAAARHSLETTRNNLLNGKPIAGTPKGTRSSRDAMVAKAAVEAARRRSIDGRNSLDSPMPDDGRRMTDSRQFSDNMKKIGSPRILSRISSRGTFTDTEARTSSDFGRMSHDGKAPSSRRSIELAAAIPREELAKRNQQLEKLNATRDLEAGFLDSTEAKLVGLETTTTKKETQNVYFDDEVNDPVNGSELSRNKSLGKMNPTIIKHLEQQEHAKNTEPDYYPEFLKKLIPRLARVASPVEKLFWFGSHHFFMWCVEFVLFFSTVVFSASTAALSLLAVRQETIEAVHIAGMVTSSVCLLFVLTRIAGIMKRYIFILHNASLVPEALAIETIQDVSKKLPPSYEYADLSGSETEREEQSAVERRKTLGKFFRSEAESGKMPGIDASEAGARRVSGDRVVKQNSRRRTARRRRSRTHAQDIPAIPDRGITSE